MELLDYEKKHIDFFEKNAGECCLFLKKDNTFPIKPCKLNLVGNGSRNTIKGGTGSGDVASRFFINAVDGFINNGFEIVSFEWMDKYDEFKKTTEKQYIKDVKKAAHKAHVLSCVFSMGYFEEEKNYEFSPYYEADCCIYVLSRNSGEGNDRRKIKGDVLLSDKEVEDILLLNKKFKKFLLVLNVGGVIDLSPIVNEVNNILLLSQLGVVTGDILANVVIGKINPSGKLTTTWAKVSDYPCFDEFGNRDDVIYREDIYVGYRYFTSANIKPLFCFGYGLSYSNFQYEIVNASNSKSIINIKVKVKNISQYPGKEVLQAYISKPSNKINCPSIELCAFTKTHELNFNQEEIIDLNFDLSENGVYDEKNSSFILEKGNYIIKVGNSSDNIEDVLNITLEEDIILAKLNNKCRSKEFNKISFKLENNNSKCKFNLLLTKNDFNQDTISYHQDQYIDPLIETLDNNSLAYICCGHHLKGFAAIVGSSCNHIVGGAGETVLRIPEIKDSLTMADGPAGIRLKQIYGVDKKGVYDVTLDPIMERMIKFLPKISKPFILPPKNRKGELHYQYTTAIPIGTALGQSFNKDFVYQCGKIIKAEMEIFNVDLWLAPALNIHRNILCGRNFEYYSEDPYLSGMIATNMIKGVEDNSKCETTIKHFACNNQEFNRNNVNSIVSERALREIYLKGFYLTIKHANPKAIMTSYNLINGIHTSEDYELLNDILRCEWKYDGLIMTDWIASGRSWCNKSKYPAPYASNNIKAGNDLTMSGSPVDIKDIKKALKNNKLTRQDLIYSASRVYRSIKKQK